LKGEKGRRREETVMPWMALELPFVPKHFAIRRLGELVQEQIDRLSRILVEELSQRSSVTENITIKNITHKINYLK
jgi:hypothetical protein